MRTFPTDLQYQQAIQHPDRCFLDSQLKFSTVAQNRMGLPVPWSGNFAYTYKLTDRNQNTWAVRCFRKHIPDRQRRYREISRYLNIHACRFLQPIDYLDNEMLVDGERYPVTKMPWVTGETIGEFVNQNFYAGSSLHSLSSGFCELVDNLQTLQIAHGDLSHDNILIQHDSIVLVDYDGMYVPNLQGMDSAELGHPNFQHPNRTNADFNPQVDRFSAIVIYLALQALIVEPDLWNRFSPKAQGGDQTEGILFKKADFKKPQQSTLLAELEKISSLRKSIDTFRRLCQAPSSEIPTLNEYLESVGFARKYTTNATKATVNPSASSAVGGAFQPKSHPTQNSPSYAIWTAISLLTIGMMALWIFGWRMSDFHPERLMALLPQPISTMIPSNPGDIGSNDGISAPDPQQVAGADNSQGDENSKTVESELVMSIEPNIPNPDSGPKVVATVVIEISGEIGALNVRNGPGTEYDVITTIPGEFKLNVLSEDNGWILIRSFDGVIEGWVASRYASIITGNGERIPFVNPWVDDETSMVNVGATAATWAPTSTPVPTQTSTSVALPTFTPVPIPTITSTTKPTLVPAPTFTQVPKATATQTAQPTAIPTFTPVPLGANCGSNADPVFTSLWQQYRSIIGCPMSGRGTIPIIAEELFQGGHMFWRSDLDEVYVIYDHTKDGANLSEGSWQTDSSWKWDGSNPDGIGLSPPSGLYEPKRGFGWLWRTHLGREDGRMGWALDREYGFNNVGQVQYFETGLMFRGSDPKVYLLLHTGKFYAR